MTVSTPLTSKWLTSVLADIGGTADEVAATLRETGVKGHPANCHDCPGARYIALRARELLPPADRVAVTLTGEIVVIGITPASADQYREVAASTPEALEDFIDGFDSGEYHDLAETPNP